MSLSHADYLNIMKFYKIDVSNISKKIKIMAEDILANKLCKCIKVAPLMKNEQNAIAVCRKSVCGEKITNFGFGVKRERVSFPKGNKQKFSKN